MAVRRAKEEEELHNKNPPTPCLWQAPASTQKTKRKTRPAIRRSARWRANPARHGRRLMRRTSRGGWLSRLAAKRQKSWVGHPEFEPQNQKPDKSAPVTPCECRAEHGPRYAGYCAAHGRARNLLAGMCAGGAGGFVSWFVFNHNINGRLCTTSRAPCQGPWLQIPDESQSDYRQDTRGSAPECPWQKTAATFRRSVARNCESFSGHCSLPQIWSNVAVNYEFCRFLALADRRRRLGAPQARVFFTHTTPNLTANGTALRVSARGAYNRRGAARTAQIRARSGVAE